jgi:ribosome biogenesis GTPase
VIEALRGVYRVAGDYDGPASMSGRYRHHSQSASDYPAVGDWVAVQEMGAVIQHRFERRTSISRAAAGRAVAEQIVAANVDTIFVVTAANEDLNPRRIERYLAMVHESGAAPVVVVNKIDLAADGESLLAALRLRLPFVDILACSATSGGSLDALSSYLAEPSTIALVGSSGVGKSTIVNRMLGRDMLCVDAIRASDGRGRHTTTTRQLVELPGGALLIDTPGMRELQPWSEESTVGDAFDDVESAAARCRYGDCQHETEPGCAVRLAIEAGSLHPDRVESYRRLQREAAFEMRKRDKAAAADEKRRWKRITQAQRSRYRLRERGD